MITNTHSVGVVRDVSNHRAGIRDMYHLVYLSAAVEHFSSAELAELLERSRAKNHTLEITGFLLHKGGNFMQVLEGDESAVQKLFKRVSADPRHRGVVRLLHGPIAERMFADWSMALGDLDDPGVRNMPGFSDFLETPLTPEVFVGKESFTLRLLNIFKRSM